jgi:rSAM/selenodomain-associated transferase 1
MPRSGKPSHSRRHGHKKKGRPPSGPAEGAIIIFAKAPVPGQVKTRLCPPLTPDEAASLHGSMVMDAVEHTRPLREFDIYLACTPSMDHPFFQTLAARHRLQLCEQVGEDFGQRMDHAITTILNRGYKYALLVGADIPNLSGHTYKQAKDMLQSKDVVFGPTKDGGYYLVGMKTPNPALFANIAWSTDRVLTQSQVQAEKLGLAMSLLEPEHDIDTFDDLQAFLDEKTGLGKTKLSTRTANVFQTLVQRHCHTS